MRQVLTALAVAAALGAIQIDGAAGQRPNSEGMVPSQDGLPGPEAFQPYVTPDLNRDTDEPVTRDRSGAPGVLTSRALHKMPEGFPVSVVTFDDTDINIEIRERLIEALQQRGQIVAEDAPLELAFNSQTIQAVLAERTPSLGEMYSGSGQSVGNRGQKMGATVQMNLWSSTKDSLIGGINPSSAQKRSPRFHINATVRDLDSGRVIWQADAISEMLTSNKSRIIRSMVGPLAASYGQTVNRQPFDLR